MERRLSNEARLSNLRGGRATLAGEYGTPHSSTGVKNEEPHTRRREALDWQGVGYRERPGIHRDS